MIRLACVAACAGLASLAAAQDIHKCMTSTGVAYQSAPCDGAQAELAVLATSRQRETADVAAAPATDGPATAAMPRRSAARWTPYRHASIAVGMSDDEILNLPGWGRPGHIARSRDRSGWHETWTYDRGDGEHALAFLNGRLATIDDPSHASLSTRLASATGR